MNGLENEMQENDEMKLKTDTVFELKLNNAGNSLKDVKNKLTKTGCIENLAQLKDDVSNVIDSYFKTGKIQEEMKEEYHSFVTALVDETDKILKKKANREERSRRM